MDMECSNRLGEDTDLNSRKSSCFSDLSEIIPNVFSCCGVVSNYTHSWVSVRAGSKVGNDIWESNSSVWKNNNTHTHTHTFWAGLCHQKKCGKYAEGKIWLRRVGVYVCALTPCLYMYANKSTVFFLTVCAKGWNMSLSRPRFKSFVWVINGTR